MALRLAVCLGCKRRRLTADDPPPALPAAIGQRPDPEVRAHLDDETLEGATLDGFREMVRTEWTRGNPSAQDLEDCALRIWRASSRPS